MKNLDTKLELLQIEFAKFRQESEAYQKENFEKLDKIYTLLSEVVALVSKRRIMFLN